jgi:hypothetical protein
MPSLKRLGLQSVAAWGYRSAAPLLNRTEAACGLSTILRAAQDFVLHYLPRGATRDSVVSGVPAGPADGLHATNPVI